LAIASVDEGEAATLSQGWVGGFYDGEGAISVQVRRYSIDLQTSFTQAYHPLLEKVKAYFDRRGIFGCLYRERGGKISRLIFGSNETVLRMLLHLLPALRLKKRQAQATIDYLTDKITGSEFLAIMNEEIDRGRRSGKRHYETLPWTRSFAIRKSRMESMELAHSAYRTMRSNPNFRELERTRAIERNHRRGDKTRRNIISLLARRPMSPTEVAEEIHTTREYARILLKELFEMDLLTRSRRGTTLQFEYASTEKGHDYLSTSRIPG